MSRVRRSDDPWDECVRRGASRSGRSRSPIRLDTSRSRSASIHRAMARPDLALPAPWWSASGWGFACELLGAIGSAEVWRRDRRCKRLDAVDDGLEADRGEEVERVLGAGQLDVDNGVGGGVAGSLGERACALCGGEGVLV